MDPHVLLLIKERLSHWDSLAQSEKELIKALILPTILSAPQIEPLLSEALAYFCSDLLPQLKISLHNSFVPDLNHVVKILKTFNLMFKKFRGKWKSELLYEHRHCLEQFFIPLMNTFKIVGLWWKTSLGNGSATATLRLLVEAQRLCCRIFYSLNFHHVHECFEESMDTWMAEFYTYLCDDYSALEGLGGDDLRLVEELRAAVCENICLYMEKEWDTFGLYLGSKEEQCGFVRNMVRLVVSNTPISERLMLAGIRFFTIFGLNKPFTDAELELIFREIPTRYLMLRDEDERLLHENDVQFIRRDVEGICLDLDMRRRAVVELIKGIGEKTKEKVIEKVSNLINEYLQQFNDNRAEKWKHMECAIYLVLSLDIENASGCLINWDVLNKTEFRNILKAELRLVNIDELPMLKASALKYFTADRNSKHDEMELIPYVIRFLASESNVVHSYAGSFIEKLLWVKDDGGRARYTSADIDPYVVSLRTNLFDALKKKGSEENHYIMKCIMRVLGVADMSNYEVYLMMMMKVNSILNEVCESPKSPIFNYHLFESLSLVIRRGCENKHNLEPIFEELIFPSLRKIFSKDLSEFFPYAFQLLAQLNLGHRFLSEYMHKFDAFLLTSAIVPSARWLQSFIKNVPRELDREERVLKVLILLDRLLASPHTHDQGFYVLNEVIGNYEHAVLACHMRPIWLTIIAGFDKDVRLSKYAKRAIKFMSLFLVKHGCDAFIQSVFDAFDALGSNPKDSFFNVLRLMWVPHLKLINGPLNIKLASVASIRLVYKLLLPSPSPSPSNPEAEAGEIGGSMFNSIVTLLTKEEERIVGATSSEKAVGYRATSVYLYNASVKEDDPLKEITDLKLFLVSTLVGSGTAREIIWNNVSDNTRSKLTEMCNLYHVPGE